MGLFRRRAEEGRQGDVLIPFPGRVAGGRYSFDGQLLQLERNDKEGPNAIHGFVRSLPWTTHQAVAHAVTYEVKCGCRRLRLARGYPFSLVVRLTYSLGIQGLSCTFSVRNVGGAAAPVGIGFHPLHGRHRADR